MAGKGRAGEAAASAGVVGTWRLEPVMMRVRWTAGEDGEPREAAVSPDGAVTGTDAGALGLSLAHDGAAWRLRAAPAVPVRIASVTAEIAAPLSLADALYLNGYNSWTDSVERDPADATPGIGVPRVVIRHWELDASGDYRFCRHDGRGGHQHGWEYGYLRRGDEVLLAGTLDADSGFMEIREDLPRERLTLGKEPPARVLEAGEEVELASFALVAGTLDAAVEEWLSLAGIACRPARPVIGYTSWYRHYADISASKLAHDLDATAEELGRFEAPGCDRVFQIDDGYAKVGDWLSPDAAKFPEGLAPLAASARERGFVPGLWLAPFVCERESRLFAEHPGWLLRDAAGRIVSTGSHWSGQVALDTRNPEVRAYVSHVLETMTGEWGFGFLKCDFLYGACTLPHAGMNRGELMADALDLVRSSVAPGTRLDFCGVPLASAFGRAEFCRVGCDVGLDWDGNWIMRRTGRERVSTKNSLANTRGRAHLDGRAFRADPDVFFLRNDVELTDEEKRALLEADASCGGVLFTSDDMARWDEGRRRQYGQALATFSRRASGE